MKPVCWVCEWVCESVSELVRRGLTCSLGDLEPPWCLSRGRSNSTTERSVPDEQRGAACHRGGTAANPGTRRGSSDAIPRRFSRRAQPLGLNSDSHSWSLLT
jgi:hypothetical protein